MNTEPRMPLVLALRVSPALHSALRGIAEAKEIGISSAARILLADGVRRERQVSAGAGDGPAAS